MSANSSEMFAKYDNEIELISDESIFNTEPMLFFCKEWNYATMRYFKLILTCLFVIFSFYKIRQSSIILQKQMTIKQFSILKKPVFHEKLFRFSVLSTWLVCKRITISLSMKSLVFTLQFLPIGVSNHVRITQIFVPLFFVFILITENYQAIL